MPYNFRNADFREVTLEVDGEAVLRFATAYGFRNIQNLVQKIKRGKSPYHYIEVMACPSGKATVSVKFKFSCGTGTHFQSQTVQSLGNFHLLNVSVDTENLS